MSLAALEQLDDALASLVAALDGEDSQAIETAAAAVPAIVAQVGESGAWRAIPQVRERAREILTKLEAARIRAHVNADVARRRIDLLAAQGVAMNPGVYGR